MKRPSNSNQTLRVNKKHLRSSCVLVKARAAGVHSMIYIYIYIYACIYNYKYIYIYIYCNRIQSIYVDICIYTYMYIYSHPRHLQESIPEQLHQATEIWALGVGLGLQAPGRVLKTPQVPFPRSLYLRTYVQGGLRSGHKRVETYTADVWISL